MGESQATILVVDDDATTAKRLEALLIPRGYRVFTASNGVEAMQQVQQERPDLILLDVLMPALDGFAFCRQIKDDADTRMIPVVLMTVLDEIGDRITGLEAGADDFLTKPVHRDELLARIRTSLRLKQSIDHKVHALYQQIQETSERRAQLFTSLSHELRTHLDAIIGFSEVLQEQTVGALNATQQEYVNYILTSGTHVLRLINGLLEQAKMETGEVHLHLQGFALRPLLEESLRLVRGQALAHDITLSLEIANDVDTVVGDAQHVKQLVYNLLSNAIQCTPDGGRAGIKASTTPERVRVAVWDTSGGISPEDQQRIFETFQQESAAQHVGAYGGLALAKKFAELHGDSITVECRPGQGNTLTFSLPLTNATPHPSGGWRTGPQE